MVHRIGIVCDFFYPRLGGVEGHVWALAQCLLRLGHKVVIITGSYQTTAGRRIGIRHMTNGLRVYYLPLLPVIDQAIFPGYFTGLPILRSIILRERLTILHGHATSSVLSHESLLQGQLLGLPTVYTDHSLYGFDGLESANLNKYLSLPLACVDAAIAVSRVGRANLVLRTGIPVQRVYAIPNAVDARKFQPDPSARPQPPTINVVLLSRLVYRKGVDLAVRVIPAACAAFPHVNFIIGGEGPKRLALEEMREKHGLHDRVQMLGAVPHAGVRDVLVRGHVFLNCSLTEAFCIAVLEAACAGCLVVTTAVGGVPEVLPPDMAILAAAPEPGALLDALTQAIQRVSGHGHHSASGAVSAGTAPKVANGSINEDASKVGSEAGERSAAGGTLLRPRCPPDPWDAHRRLREAYSWMDVARRTVRAYDDMASAPRLSLPEQFERWLALGPLYGPIAACLMAVILVMTCMLEWVRPALDVDVVPDTLDWTGGNSDSGGPHAELFGSVRSCVRPFGGARAGPATDFTSASSPGPVTVKLDSSSLRREVHDRRSVAL